jgi:hypothetical protein
MRDIELILNKNSKIMTLAVECSDCKVNIKTV